MRHTVCVRVCVVVFWGGGGVAQGKAGGRVDPKLNFVLHTALQLQKICTCTACVRGCRRQAQEH